MPGSRISVNSLRSFPTLAILFVIAFLIYIFLKKPTSSSLPILTQKNKADFATIMYSILKALGLSDDIARYATSQAAFETNNFTSKLFLNYNNAFGMTYVKQPNASGQVNGYATYKTVEDSAKDFVRWYNINRSGLFPKPLFINSLADYVSFLKNYNYFEADESEYYAGCQYFYNQLFSGQ